MSLSRYTNTSSSNSWGYPLYLCDCCPYGYHIDLDFVRYCESISREADRTGSIKRRRDRRRQRKSMEVLLGLNSLVDQKDGKPSESISPIVESRLLHKQDSFDNVVDDFEKTLQRSKNKLSNNLPDVTAVSDIRSCQNVSSEANIKNTPGKNVKLKKFPNRDFGGTNDFSSPSPITFKNIREQMALSLERTRQLEEENKQIPELKIQISTLKDENKRILQKLKIQEEKLLNTINFNHRGSFDTRNRSNSFSQIDNCHENGVKQLITKDVGVTCSVLTRNVGVGHQTPSRKNASTATASESNFADKWLGEKLKFISDQYEVEKVKTKVIQTNRSSQTQFLNTHNQPTQTPEIKLTIPQTKLTDKQVQTLHFTGTNRAVLAKPTSSDFFAQKTVEVYNIGVSDDTVTDINCEKCSVAKTSIAVGADKNEDSHIAPISLASLSFPRSKSFNLGDDKINLCTRNRSIAIQYQFKPDSSTKSSQYAASNSTKSCQSNIKTYSRGSQYDSNEMVETSTQSEESSFRSPKKVPKKDVACQIKEPVVKTQSIGSNTLTFVCEECKNREGECENKKNKLEKKEDPEKREDNKEVKKKDDLISGASRIPILSVTPTMERRKFRRQDTYTKINTSPPPEEIYDRLSGLDLSTKTTTTTTSTFDKVKENFKFPETPENLQAQNEVNKSVVKLSSTFDSPTCSSSPYIQTGQSKYRDKAIPSREMQGAMKVLNDSLQKQIKLPKSHRAVDIIQQEWFRISGLVSANPLDVEDYLDAFEDMSSLLLGYIVNMTDDSGNTAMHYAVSHGNFDVVSILLDSKVCDINKPNKAGYTSVMLVSLADIRSQTHANVVRRLFQMADVNIRAKQHGQTALMLAVSHGRLDMVKMLLEAGADINIQDDDGSTALMCAAEHGHIEIVKHFLSQPDCDSTITDVDGSTALKIAMEAEHRPIGVLLYAHERNLMATHGHKHKKKTTSPKPPSSPLSIRQSQSALNDMKSSK